MNQNLLKGVWDNPSRLPKQSGGEKGGNVEKGKKKKVDPVPQKGRRVPKRRPKTRPKKATKWWKKREKHCTTPKKETPEPRKRETQAKEKGQMIVRKKGRGSPRTGGR